MKKLAFKDVNIIQGFTTHSREVYTQVYDQLKDSSEHVYIGWAVNEDDPYDVTFRVGARNEGMLHKFIEKHASVLSQLSPEAEMIIQEFYTHNDRFFTVVQAPEGATPVNYKELPDVRDGAERNSSWWYDCNDQKVYTKREIIDNQLGFEFHKFVKVRD